MPIEKTSPYHRQYEKWTGRFSEVYSEVYRKIYTRAYTLAKSIGRDPFIKEVPQILLCGTASSETTKRFTRFVKDHNANSCLVVLDLDARPLATSKEVLEKENLAEQVSFLPNDARHTGLADHCMDLIETDLFLQFFSREDKQKVINEWARILAADGVITTREFVPGTEFHKILNQLRIATARWLGAHTYETSIQELEELFKNAGLEVKMVPFKYGPLNSNLLEHIIAYKKGSLPAAGR